MDIFGLEPVVAAIIFTATGGVLQLVLGYLGNSEAFDWKKAASTAIVTTVVGVVGVSQALGAIADTATELEILAIVAIAIGSIAGFDGLKNSVIKAVKKSK